MWDQKNSILAEALLSMWLDGFIYFDRFLGSDDRDSFFLNKDRQRIVYELLATTTYGKKKRAEIGIERLLEEEVLSAAFPLHDVSLEERVSPW